MVLPVGADVDEVDVVALAKFFPTLAPRVGGGTRQAFGFQDLGLHGFHAVGLNVAQGVDGHAVDVGHAVDGIGTTHAEADKADADVFDGVNGELQDALLSFNALRFVKDDGVVNDAVVALADFRFCGFLFATCGGHRNQDEAED